MSIPRLTEVVQLKVKVLLTPRDSSMVTLRHSTVLAVTTRLLLRI